MAAQASPRKLKQTFMNTFFIFIEGRRDEDEEEDDLPPYHLAGRAWVVFASMLSFPWLNLV
jgi:hypothetical protein